MSRWTTVGHCTRQRKAWQIRLGVLISGLLLASAVQNRTADANTGIPDTVVFLNGDRLSGHLKLASRDSVAFTGLVTGDVSLNWKDIKELDLNSSRVSIASSQNAQAFQTTGSVIEVSPTVLCVRVKSKCLETFPISQLIAASVVEPIRPAVAPKNPYFKAAGGTLKVSPESVIRATQKQIQLAGVFDLGLVTNTEDAFKHQETSVALEANYSDSRKPGGSAVITNLYSANIQQKFFVTDTKTEDGLYVYGVTNFYHNRSLGMNLAQSYGAGLGWDGDHGRSSYTLAGDIRYLGEDLFAPGKPLSLAVAGLLEEYSYTFPWHDINWYERILFLPAFNDSRAFQLRGTTGLDVPIRSNISFDADLLDDYIRNAPPNTLQNFAKITFSFKYVIGAPPKSQ